MPRERVVTTGYSLPVVLVEVMKIDVMRITAWDAALFFRTETIVSPLGIGHFKLVSKMKRSDGVRW
jgi:hypothetical protein